MSDAGCPKSERQSSMVGTNAIVAKWDEIPDEWVREGVRRRGFGTDDVTLVLNHIDPKMTPSPHTHSDFDQIAMILSGTAIYHVGAQAHPVSTGSLLLIPAGTEHYIVPTGDEIVANLDVFSPARADYAHLLEWMGRARGA